MIRRPPRSTLFPYTTLFRSPDALVRVHLVAKHARGELQSLLADLDGLAAAAVRLHELRARLDDDCDVEIIAVGDVLQRFLERLLGELPGELRVAFRAAIAVAPIVILHAAAQRLVRRLLVAREDGRIDADPAAVGLVLVAFEHGLPDHLRE